MAINLPRQTAEKVLLEAFRGRCTKNDDITKKIAFILNGTHKTYRYILLTGLLGKAVNEEVNPICLQAGAPLSGAYDARSLCHQVVVPFERDFLHNVLGGSNEPFLNKPARFTHLALTNAVRRGSDRVILVNLIEVLSSIKTSEKARQYLACCLNFLSSKIDTLLALKATAIKYNPTLVEVFEFIVNFLDESHEGETCVLITATLEKLHYRSVDDKIKVVPHKSNQSGASSKEVGDIDIYKEKQYLYSIEVKDKDFNEHDFTHAIEKISKAGGNKAQFVVGPQGKFDIETIEKVVSDYQKLGVLVMVNSILKYARHMLIKTEVEDKTQFINTLLECSDEINARDSTRNWIREVLADLNWT